MKESDGQHVLNPNWVIKFLQARAQQPTQQQQWTAAALPLARMRHTRDDDGINKVDAEHRKRLPSAAQIISAF